MGTHNEKRNAVLVWVTNPDACESIVSAGRMLADENESELVIVSIQGSIKGNWSNYANDLVKLNECARNADAELTVVYSENRFEAAHNTIKEVKPIIMVAGLPGTMGRSVFLDQISSMAPNIPTYSVDFSGNMVRLDSIKLQIS